MVADVVADVVSAATPKMVAYVMPLYSDGGQQKWITYPVNAYQNGH